MDGDEKKGITRYSDGSQVVSSSSRHHKKQKKTRHEEYRYSSDPSSSPQIQRTFTSEDKEEHTGDPELGALMEKRFSSLPKEGWIVQEKQLTKRSQQVHVRHEVTKNGETTVETKNLGFMEIKHSDDSKDNKSQKFEDRYFHPIHTPSGRERQETKDHHDTSRDKYESSSRISTHRDIHRNEMKENLPVKTIDHYNSSKNAHRMSNKAPNHGEERYEVEEPDKLIKVERQWRQEQTPGHFHRMEIYKTESKGKVVHGDKKQQLYLDYYPQTPDTDDMETTIPIITSPPPESNFSAATKDEKQVRFKKTIEERREDRAKREGSIKRREELEKMEEIKQMEKRKDIEYQIKISKERGETIPAKRRKNSVEFDEPDYPDEERVVSSQHQTHDAYTDHSRKTTQQQIIMEKQMHRRKVLEEQNIHQPQTYQEIPKMPPQYNRNESSFREVQHRTYVQPAESQPSKQKIITTPPSQYYRQKEIIEKQQNIHMQQNYEQPSSRQSFPQNNREIQKVEEPSVQPTKHMEKPIKKQQHIQKEQYVEQHVRQQHVQQEQNIEKQYHQQNVQHQHHVQKEHHIEHMQEQPVKRQPQPLALPPDRQQTQQRQIRQQQQIQHYQMVQHQEQRQEQYSQRQQMQQHLQNVPPPALKQEKKTVKKISFSEDKNVRDLEAKIDRAYWEYQLEEQEKEIMSPHPELQEIIPQNINIKTIEGTDIREDIGEFTSPGHIGLTIKSETVISPNLTQPSSGINVRVETPPQQILLHEEPDWMKEVRVRRSYSTERKIEQHIEDEPDFRKVILKKTTVPDHSFDDSDVQYSTSLMSEGNLKKASSLSHINSVEFHSSQIRNTVSMSNISPPVQSQPQFTHIIPVQSTENINYSSQVNDSAVVTVHNTSALISPILSSETNVMPRAEMMYQEEPSWKTEIKKRKMIKSETNIRQRMEVEDQKPEFASISLKKVDSDIKTETHKMDQSHVTIETNSFIQSYPTVLPNFAQESVLIQEESYYNSPRTSTPVKPVYREEKRSPLSEPAHIDVVTKMPITSGTFSPKTTEDSPSWMLEAKKRKAQRLEDVRSISESEIEPEWKNISLKKVDIDLKKPLSEESLIDVKLKHIEHSSITQEKVQVTQRQEREPITSPPADASKVVLKEKPLRQLYQEKLLHLIEARHKSSQKSSEDGMPNKECFLSDSSNENREKLITSSDHVLKSQFDNSLLNNVFHKKLTKSFVNIDSSIKAEKFKNFQNVSLGSITIPIPLVGKLKKWETISQLCENQTKSNDNQKYCENSSNIEQLKLDNQNAESFSKMNELNNINMTEEIKYQNEDSSEINILLESVNKYQKEKFEPEINDNKGKETISFQKSDIFLQNDVNENTSTITKNPASLSNLIQDKLFFFNNYSSNDFFHSLTNNSLFNVNNIPLVSYDKNAIDNNILEKEKIFNFNGVYRLNRIGPIKSKIKKSRFNHIYSYPSHKFRNYVFGILQQESSCRKHFYGNYQIPHENSIILFDKISPDVTSTGIKVLTNLEMNNRNKKNISHNSSLYGHVVFSFYPQHDFLENYESHSEFSKEKNSKYILQHNNSLKTCGEEKMDCIEENQKQEIEINFDTINLNVENIYKSCDLKHKNKNYKNTFMRSNHSAKKYLNNFKTNKSEFPIISNVCHFELFNSLKDFNNHNFSEKNNSEIINHSLSQIFLHNPLENVEISSERIPENEISQISPLLIEKTNTCPKESNEYNNTSKTFNSENMNNICEQFTDNKLDSFLINNSHEGLRISKIFSLSKCEKSFNDNIGNFDTGSPGKPFGGPGNPNENPISQQNYGTSTKNLTLSKESHSNPNTSSIFRGSPGKPHGSQGNPNDLPPTHIVENYGSQHAKITNEYEFNSLHRNTDKSFSGPDNSNSLLEHIQNHNGNPHGSPGKPHGDPGNPIDNPNLSLNFFDVQELNEKTDSGITLLKSSESIDSSLIESSVQESADSKQKENLEGYYIEILPPLDPSKSESSLSSEVINIIPETDARYIELRSPKFGRSNKIKSSNSLNVTEKKDRYIVLRSPELCRTNRFKKQDDAILENKDIFSKTSSVHKSHTEDDKNISSKMVFREFSARESPHIEKLHKRDNFLDLNFKDAFKDIREDVVSNKTDGSSENESCIKKFNDDIENDFRHDSLDKSLILDKESEQYHNIKAKSISLGDGVKPSTHVIHKIAEINFEGSNKFNVHEQNLPSNIPPHEKHLLETPISIASHIADIHIESKSTAQFNEVKEHLMKESFQIISRIANTNAAVMSYGDKLSKALIDQAITESLELSKYLHMKYLMRGNGSAFFDISCNVPENSVVSLPLESLSENDSLRRNSAYAEFSNENMSKYNLYSSESYINEKLKEVEREREQILLQRKQSVQEEPIVAVYKDNYPIKYKTVIDSEQKINMLKELISQKPDGDSSESAFIENSKEKLNQDYNCDAQNQTSANEYLNNKLYNVSQNITSNDRTDIINLPSKLSLYQDHFNVQEPIYENLPQECESLYENIDYNPNNHEESPKEYPIYENVQDLKGLNNEIYGENIYHEISTHSFKQSYINPIYDLTPASKSLLSPKDTSNYDSTLFLNLKTEDNHYINPLKTANVYDSEVGNNDYLSKEDSNQQFLCETSLKNINNKESFISDLVNKEKIYNKKRDSCEFDRSAVEEHVIENVTHIQKSGKIETLQGIIADEFQNMTSTNASTKPKLIIIDNDKISNLETSVHTSNQSSNSFEQDQTILSTCEVSPDHDVKEMKLNETTSLPDCSTFHTTQSSFQEKTVNKSDNFVASSEILNDPSVLLQSLKIDSNKETPKTSQIKTKSSSAAYQFEQPSWIAQAKRNKYERMRKMTWSTEDDPEETAALTEIVKKYECLDRPLAVHIDEKQGDRLDFAPPLPLSPPPLLMSRNDSDTIVKAEASCLEPEWMTNIKKKKYHRKERVTTEICGTPFSETVEKDDKSEGRSVAQYLDIESKLTFPKVIETKDVESKVPKKLAEMRKEYIFFSLQPDWMMEAKRNKYCRMQKMKIDSEEEISKDEKELEYACEKIVDSAVKKVLEENERKKVNDEVLNLPTKHSHEAVPISPQSPASSTASEPIWMSEVRRLKKMRERRASIDSQSSTSSGKINLSSEDFSPLNRDDDFSKSGVVIEHNKSPLELVKMFDKEIDKISDRFSIGKPKQRSFTTSFDFEPSWLSEVKKQRSQRIKHTYNILKRNNNEIENFTPELLSTTDKSTLENNELEYEKSFYKKKQDDLFKKEDTSIIFRNENEQIEKKINIVQDKNIFLDSSKLCEIDFASQNKSVNQEEKINFLEQNMTQKSASLDNNFNHDNKSIFLPADKKIDMISTDMTSEVKSDKHSVIKLDSPQPYKSPSHNLTHSFLTLKSDTSHALAAEINDSNIENSEFIYEEMSLYNLPPYKEPSWIIEAKKNKKKRIKKMGNLDNFDISDIPGSISHSSFEKSEHEAEDISSVPDNFKESFVKAIIVEDKTKEINNSIKSDSITDNVSTLGIKDLNLQLVKKTEKLAKSNEEPSWILEAKRMQQKHLEKTKEDIEIPTSVKSTEAHSDLFKTTLEESHIYDSDTSSVTSEKVNHEEVVNKRSDVYSFEEEPSWILEAKKNKLKRLQKMQARSGSYTLVFNSTELPQSDAKDSVLKVNEPTQSSNETSKLLPLKSESDFIIDSGLKTESWNKAIKHRIMHSTNDMEENINPEKEIFVISQSSTYLELDSAPSICKETTPLKLEASLDKMDSHSFVPNINFVESKSKSRSLDSHYEYSFEEEPSWVAEARKKQMQRMEKMKMLKQQKISKIDQQSPKESCDLEDRSMETAENLKSQKTFLITEADLPQVTASHSSSKFFHREIKKVSPSKFSDIFELEKPSWISEVKKSKRNRIQKLGLLEDPECLQPVQEVQRQESEHIESENKFEEYGTGIDKYESTFEKSEKDNQKSLTAFDKGCETPSWRYSIKENTYQKLRRSLLEEPDETTKVYNIKSNVKDLLFEEEMESLQKNKDNSDNE